MAMFEWRIRLYPPNPLEPIPGLGLLDGYVAAPHFDRFRAERWAPRLAHRLGGLGIIGLDESTGLVGWPDELRVIGPGAVTVIEQGVMTAHPTGATVSVDLLAGARLRPLPPRWSPGHPVERHRQSVPLGVGAGRHPRRLAG